MLGLVTGSECKIVRSLSVIKPNSWILKPDVGTKRKFLILLSTALQCYKGATVGGIDALTTDDCGSGVTTCSRCKYPKGASIYDVRTEGGRGVPSKAYIVSNLSKGGCMNLRKGGRGSKNPKILRTSYMEAPYSYHPSSYP